MPFLTSETGTQTNRDDLDQGNCLGHGREDMNTYDHVLHPLNGNCPSYGGSTKLQCHCGAAATWHNNMQGNQSTRFPSALCEGCAVELRILLALKG